MSNQAISKWQATWDWASGIGQPIRSLYETIGNSLVTSALILGVFFATPYAIVSYHHGVLLVTKRYQAEEMHYEQQLRVRRLEMQLLTDYPSEALPQRADWEAIHALLAEE